MVPGPPEAADSGLAACPSGSRVGLFRCANREQCGSEPAARALVGAGETRQGGAFSVAVSAGAAGSGDLLLVVVNFAGGGEYRALAGLPGNQEGMLDVADVRVDPNSEALVRLVADAGAAVSNQTLADLDGAVRAVTRNVPFAGLGVEEAALEAAVVAAQDAAVQALLERGKKPTPTGTPASASPTPTVTPTLAPGANISFFGVLRADNTLLEPAGVDAEGRPLYTRLVGSGFVIVVEARPGADGAPVGRSSFRWDPADPTVRPDLQIQVNRPLGNGSTEVCDNRPDRFGGVPGIDPPSFAEAPEIAEALNDFGCRFIDGSGDTLGRPPDEACVKFPDGEFRFVDPLATVEFCATISRPLAFPPGDTVVTARVRDAGGTLGPPRQIVVRVGG